MSSDALARVVNWSAHPVFASRPWGLSKIRFYLMFSVGYDNLPKMVEGRLARRPVSVRSGIFPVFAHRFGKPLKTLRSIGSRRAEPRRESSRKVY
jgi:hypothetical protein